MESEGLQLQCSAAGEGDAPQRKSVQHDSDHWVLALRGRAQTSVFFRDNGDVTERYLCQISFIAPPANISMTAASSNACSFSQSTN